MKQYRAVLFARRFHALRSGASPAIFPRMGVDTSRSFGQELVRERPRSGNSERFYIPTLDGWRAIAVSLVIGGHCYTMLMNNGSAPARSLAALFNHAGYGVDIFFALSGYLICTLLLSEKRATGTISLARFYTRRAFRILPPMLLYVFVIDALSLLTLLPRLEPGELSSVVLFYRNYVTGSWYTGHFWSLAIEEHFYAAAPILLLLFNSRSALRLSFVLIAFCICVRALEYRFDLFPGTLIQFRTENRFDGLMWGAVLALALQNADARDRLRRWLNVSTFLATIVVAVILLVELDSQPERRTIVAAVMPILLGHTILNSHSPIARLLELAPLRWFGRISYSLYIWQMMFLVVENRPLGIIQSFPLALICPVVCATVSYYFVEKPIIALGHRLTAAPRAASALRESAAIGEADAKL